MSLKASPDRRARAAAKNVRVLQRWERRTASRDAWLAAAEPMLAAVISMRTAPEAFDLRHVFTSTSGRAWKGADGWWRLEVRYFNGGAWATDHTGGYGSKDMALAAFDLACKKAPPQSA